MYKIALAGGGIGSSALISLLRGDPNTRIAGIYEKKKDVPGVVLARRWNIPVFTELEELISAGPEMVINVTGDPVLSNEIRQAFKGGVEVIEGSGARFLWEIIEKQKRSKIEAIKTLSDLKILYKLSSGLFSVDAEEVFYEMVLAKSLNIADGPAGCIAIYKDGGYSLLAAKGLSRRFLEDKTCFVLPGGLTGHVLDGKEPAEIVDTLKADKAGCLALLSEKIRAVLALPVLINGVTAGILYLYDFKPRRFSLRHKTSLTMATGIIAFAIERYALIKTLEEYEYKVSGLVETCNEPVLITDADGIIISCNEAASGILGYSRDDLPGRPVTSIIEDSSGSLMETIGTQTYIKGYDITVINSNGGKTGFKLNASMLKDRVSSHPGTVFIFYMGTEELEARNALENKLLRRTEELQRTNKELQRMNQRKGKFTANISHELRTPLNSIIGFSSILAEKTFGPLTETQERYIKNIHSAGKHLLELINNMLDIAKIESGKYEMVYETFRAEDLLEGVLGIMHPLADDKSITMDMQKGEDVDLITADRVKIKQILYNLLSNAIKFTAAHGSIGIKVIYEIDGKGNIIWPHSGNEFLKFSVWDTGLGISPGDRERIFDEFEQVDTSLSRESGGAGLGLALCRKLVELHGGEITVESEPGRGSTFVFTLPVTSQGEETTKEEVEAVSLNFPWMKENAPLILAVEDDAATAEILTYHLTQAGYKVAHAFNGEDAVEKARKMRPFAITLDVMLSKKDGWEVLQELKTDPRTSDIPVIIHSIVDNKELAFALGATDYLLKPLDKDLLLSKLEEINISKGKPVIPTSILVIESDEKVTNYFREIFEPQGFLIYTAMEGRRGIELAAALRPGLILMDFTLPDMLGFDAVKELKENPSTEDIPIFILTERDISVEDRLSLVGKIERIVRKHAFDTKGLIDHIKDLEILYPKRAGLIDAQTELFNHRYFQIRLAQEVERATRYKLPLNLVLIDIDFFGKYIYDHGEYYGNIVLSKVAELLRKNVRGSDIVVRYGGDSFIVILPNTVITAALSLSNRFNAIIKNYPFLHEETQPKGKLTASVGLVFLDGQTTEEFISCAEKALTVAIHKGGDRVEIYERENEEPDKAGL